MMYALHGAKDQALRMARPTFQGHSRSLEEFIYLNVAVNKSSNATVECATQDWACLLSDEFCTEDRPMEMQLSRYQKVHM